MTTSCLKPATQTSQRLDRSTTATTSRSGGSPRQPNTTAARTDSAGAAKRFLTALMHSLSAWAV